MSRPLYSVLRRHGLSQPPVRTCIRSDLVLPGTSNPLNPSLGQHERCCGDSLSVSMQVDLEWLGGFREARRPVISQEVGMLLSFLFFAPFTETVAIGQANAFSLMAILASLYLSER